MSLALVIIPTYNERENIAYIIEAVFSLDKSYHILVVDDNSKDGTIDIVRDIQHTHHERLFLKIRREKMGLGTAYIEGFKWALNREYDYIFEMDADFSHNPKDLDKLYNACLCGADLAIGSRYVRGINVVNWPLRRVLLSYFASMYVQFIMRMPIKDPTSGFVCYRRAALEKIDLDRVKFIGYAFQIEMKFKVWLEKFKIEEKSIIFTDRERGSSKMSTSIINEAIFGIVLLKIKSLFRRK
ncbi:polyprenol monophosphomannose synthase [Ichthyobacterium seriolicida]|uniref:Dolichol-phosphate mannosyltransferase n=1 Tax=Ichthyobacterium seriolicida TaxID=242600 RepID=A0A1J1EBH1_9FLAO|nr:polyprenol monophosphomannose synthase [Ichthyobacterium seriolicida]BAV94856.1 dolichol-phosphate mannosyltransferase [Ichthyobacterium seriolicida]